MKKILLIAFVLGLFTACENETLESEFIEADGGTEFDGTDDNQDENNDNNDDDGNTLFKLTKTASSGNIYEHVYEEGYKKTQINYNGTLFQEFNYDTNDNMISFIEYSVSSGTINFSITFNYNSSNEIISIDEFESTIFGDITQNRILNYSNNTLTIPLAIDTGNTPPTNDLVYTFNSNNQLINFKQFNENNTQILENTYTFSNSNCTSINLIYGEPNSSTQYDFNFDYHTDIINPLKNFSDSYYLNLVIIYGRYRSNSFQWNNIVIETSNNGLNTTTIPSQFPDGTIFQGFSNSYQDYIEVNQNDYPIEVNSILTPSNSIGQTFIYEYTN